jgi:hypothetical protein
LGRFRPLTEGEIHASHHCAPRPAFFAAGASVLVVASLAIGAATLEAAPAAPKQYLANINAGQETPPLAEPGFGVAHLTLDNATDMLCFSISFDGLASGEIAAHIHGPSQPGVPSGIIFPLALGNPKNGCVGPLTNQQAKDLNKNLWYINIHTSGHTGGELRGQILRIK